MPFLAQHLHAAMQIHAYGSVCKSGARSDFRSGQAFNETQNERLAISFWKLAHRIEQSYSFC